MSCSGAGSDERRLLGAVGASGDWGLTLGQFTVHGCSCLPQSAILLLPELKTSRQLAEAGFDDKGVVFSQQLGEEHCECTSKCDFTSGVQRSRGFDLALAAWAHG